MGGRAIAVSISPKGCHPSKPVTDHSNIASPGTCLSFCLSGSEWLLFKHRSLWLVREIDEPLTRVPMQHWRHVHFYCVADIFCIHGDYPCTSQGFHMYTFLKQINNTHCRSIQWYSEIKAQKEPNKSLRMDFNLSRPIRSPKLTIQMSLKGFLF